MAIKDPGTTCTRCGCHIGEQRYRHRLLCDGCGRLDSRESTTASRRRKGMKSADQNPSCAQFLGVHVAENILSKVFKDVVRMPNCNIGYDFVCNNGFRVDLKSSCTQQRDGGSDHWQFSINHNVVADYFLCIAFDNRADLTPLHCWLIPCHVVYDHRKTSVSLSTLSKWHEYRVDKMDEIMEQRDKMRSPQTIYRMHDKECM